jgi:hypothetical protein
VDNEYRTVTLGPWYAEGDDAMSFRLYLGATPHEPVDGMFSFVPCLPADRAGDTQFPRPEIRLPGTVTSHLRQGKKITKLGQLEEAFFLWTEVVGQIETRDLALATTLNPPTVVDPGGGDER